MQHRHVILQPLLAGLLGLWLAVPVAVQAEVSRGAEVTPVTGDIVLRAGNGAWAFLARRFSESDPRWSHAGVILREGETVRVVHMDGSPAGGEIRADSLEAFSEGPQAMQLVRTGLDAAQRRRVGDWLAGQLARGTPFDTQFRLEDDSALYCSELVWRALEHVDPALDQADLPRMAGRSYIPVDRLLQLGDAGPVPGPGVPVPAVQ